MNTKKILVWLLGFLSLILCCFFYFRSNRYKITNEKGNYSYKIDTWTGEVWVLHGNQQIKVQSPKEENKEKLKNVSTEQRVNNLIEENEYERALTLVNKNNNLTKDQIDLLKEKIHLNYGMHLAYRGESGMSMRDRMVGSLSQYIKVLKINPSNQKAHNEIKQIMGIYKTMPQSPPQNILDKLKSLGLNTN